SVLLTLRTLKLLDHLSHDKVPPQFEAISSPEADSESTAKKSSTEAESTVINKKEPFSGPMILQESKKFKTWSLNDCALMTWLDASMNLTYKNRV
ncbi:hypothetical protein PIB30_088931, partial [Stylosanthes scabra]|nr:hypothetical protein [Stylosanthes scabra]